MKIRLPTFNNQSFINDLIPTHAIGIWSKESSSKASSDFKKTLKGISQHFPLSHGKSEDQVVEALLIFFRDNGWSAKDKRSTFVEGTDHKPDIWLDSNLVFLEALSQPAVFDQQNWIEHCSRTVEYSKYAQSRIGICTDGRRWFVVSTVDGELKMTFIDLKKFEDSSAEIKLLATLLCRRGPLYDKELQTEIRDYANLSKRIFKNHIMRVISKLDENYREYFGLISATAYAHYNKVASDSINTKPIYDCVFALKHEHFDAAVAIIKEYFVEIESDGLPGLSNLASRVKKLVGKNREVDIAILSALLLDQNEKPLSWETFNSDDLSEVYEELCKVRKKQNGIYATQRDVCYHVVKRQLEQLSEKANLKKLALVDPCCGSGSFLDQAARVLGETIFPPGKRSRDLEKTKSITFYGQDKEEVAVAISMVNVTVACTRYLWHMQDLEIDIQLSCGDSTDKRSPLYKKVDAEKPTYRMIFGNPPYLRSRNKTFGGSGQTGNLLFHVTEKVMDLCNPGELAFVLPAHIKGGDASLQFDQVSLSKEMKITEFWHLPEIKFRGCSEKRHVVVFWEQDKRADAKILVLTPPQKFKETESIFNLIERSKNSSSCHFKVESTPLAEIPLYANQYIPKDIANAFLELPTIGDFKDAGILTVVQGVQVVHPRVPRPSKKGEDKSRLNSVLEEEGYEVNAPVFCLKENEISELRSGTVGNFTQLESSNIKLFAENSPTEGGMRMKPSDMRILFTDKNFSHLSETQFEQLAPHFCSWLKPYKPLLLTDKDRKNGPLKWWEIQRSRSPRPNGKTNPGIEFHRGKVLVSRMLSGELWAWYDDHGHVAGGTTFCAISPWPQSDIEETFREGWKEMMSAWLNSYLVRQIWIKLLNNFKLRGIDGEVQMAHLLKMPMPEGFFYQSSCSKTETLIAQLSMLAKDLAVSCSPEKLIALDKICWKLLEATSGHTLGTPITRKSMNRIDLKASA